MKLRAIVVSHHQKFRQSLAQFVELIDPCVEVIGEVSGAREAMNRIEALRPALVLLDLGLRRSNALNLTGRIHAQWPETAIVVIGNELIDDYRHLALAAGAIEYVDVLEIATQLPLALHLVNHPECCDETEIADAQSSMADASTFIDQAALLRSRWSPGPTGPKHGPLTAWQYVHIGLVLMLVPVILALQLKVDLELQRTLLLVLALAGITIVEVRQFARACHPSNRGWRGGILKGGVIANE